MKYKINDIEANKATIVEAPGFIEAMLEYLPWPSLQLDVDYKPHHGRMTATDKQTDFMYRVDIVSEPRTEK